MEVSTPPELDQIMTSTLNYDLIAVPDYLPPPPPHLPSLNDDSDVSQLSSSTGTSPTKQDYLVDDVSDVVEIATSYEVDMSSNEEDESESSNHINNDDSDLQ
jgi:hypothetical protein